MTPATVTARSALYQKSIIAHALAGEIGKRTFGRPVSLEHRWRAAEAWRRFNAMSAEARREYYFAKRAKYLINCLTTERYRRVFRLRCEGDDGKMVELETWIHRRAHPVTLLLKLMRMPEAPLVLRLRLCKNCRGVPPPTAQGGGRGRARGAAIGACRRRPPGCGDASG
jgi:hypothetical protein